MIKRVEGEKNKKNFYEKKENSENCQYISLYPILKKRNWGL